MLDWKFSSWLYPKPTGDLGRDRNARTVQFACFLLAFAVGVVAVLNLVSGEPGDETPVLVFAVASLVFAAAMNRAGRWQLAAMTAFLAVLLTAILLVLEARDGFRSLAMLIFPGLLLISVMLLYRASYVITAGIVLVAVAALGIAEKRGLTRAIPRVRTPTSYDSIFFVDLNLLVFASIGSRIARDNQRNIRDLRVSINGLSSANLELTKKAEALRESEQQLVSIYNTVQDVIFQLAVEPENRYRFVSVNTAFVRVTGLSREMVIGKTVNEVIPEPSSAIVVGKYRKAIEERTTVRWEETSDYPSGRLTGEVSVTPVFDLSAKCTHLVGSVHDITERKRAEAAVRESEERFRSVADSAPVMIWVAGLDKQCTFFNGPWLEFAGHTIEQELADGWASRIHPEDLDRSLAAYTASSDARQPFQMEYRLRRADGEYRWILDNGKPLYRDEEFAGFIGSCIDVTEQKLIERRLRANEVQLTDAQRLARVGSFEVHIDSDRVYWSDEIYRIFGLTNHGPSDFATFLQSVHPKDREKVLESARKVRSTGATVETEYRIVRPDLEVRFVRSIVEAIRNDQGETVRLAGATQDLTEQVQARERLRDSEARLKNAERLAHLGHWQWHLKTNQLIWSDECYRIFGQPPNYAPSLDLLQSLVPEDRARVERETGHRLAEKKGGAIEFRIVRPDGKLRTIRSVSEMLLDEEGEPESFFGACQDITEEKRAQEESVARQKLESVGTLANGIAHDFNNLLGGVLAQAELALGELAGGSNPEAELRAIRDTALRGSEIVRELMIYAGKESSVVEPIDVSQIVTEMLELLKVSVSKHAVLEADLGKNIAAARGNAAQIRQVVMNLVTNASEAIGDRDGVIRVSTREVTINRNSGPISDRVADGDYVQLEVSDTGRGMSPETQAKVFDPFFTTKSAGHGLGLAIVQGIVRGLGGLIQLISEPVKGTTIQILLPAAEGAAGGSAGDALSSAADSTDPSLNTVLVVEDEHLLRQAVAKMLRKNGFKVLEAADGSTAIDILRANAGSIDVILLDMTIPGASPLEVVAESEKARTDTRVLLTSAYNQEMIANSTRAAPQIRGFIRKPFQLGDLLRVLRETLSS